jgi:Trypsin-like peptidase domain
MLWRFVLTFAFLCISISGFSQVTANVFRRTFLIQFGEDRGTAFTIDVDGREYLVTASHVVKGLVDGHEIKIKKGQRWVPLKITKVLKCADPIDITVMVPPEQISVNFKMEPTMAGVQYGQEVYFVGYPYGVFLTSGTNLNADFPLASLKRGTMSATDDTNGVDIIYLDGFNNPGFSGGPVVFRDFAKPGYELNVMGVVSGYPNEYKEIYTMREIAQGQVTSDDIQENLIVTKNQKIYHLDETNQLGATNSGIVKAFNIRHAVDIIKKNPVGPKVTDTFVDWPKP